MDLLLAKTWNPQTDVKGWWMSEKYDGIRAYFDGVKLLTRTGKRIHAPQWFVRNLGTRPLDGELWIGRGRFDEVSGIVRSLSAPREDWERVFYHVFDLPTLKLTFEQRMERLEGMEFGDRVRLIEHTRVQSNDHVLETLDQTTKDGGEGLMLRQPKSLYERKRSSTLLKVKKQLDMEAEVVDQIPGTGRLDGLMGALQCKTKGGQIFKVGSGFTDDQRRDPPKVGDTITIHYFEITKNGVPRFPTFHRIFK